MVAGARAELDRYDLNSSSNPFLLMILHTPIHIRKLTLYPF
jgi:hypothetical protein